MDCNVLLKFIFWVAGQPTKNRFMRIKTNFYQAMGKRMGPGAASGIILA